MFLGQLRLQTSQSLLPPGGGLGHIDFPVYFFGKITNRAKNIAVPSAPVSSPVWLPPGDCSTVGGLPGPKPVNQFENPVSHPRRGGVVTLKRLYDPGPFCDMWLAKNKAHGEAHNCAYDLDK